MEMSYLFFILEIVSVAAALVALASFLNGKERVILAEAGPMDEADAATLHENLPKQKRAYILDHDGKVMNTRDKLRIRVVGKCMEPKNIVDGGEYYVTKINKSKDFNSQINSGDILLIYYPQKDIYKIRVFEKYGDGQELITYRYNTETGVKRYSNKRHLRENVRGIVCPIRIN